MNSAVHSPLVIGYGNVLRADDAVGLHVARAMAAAGYNSIEVPQLFPELAEEIAQASFVVFVDCHMDLRPGEAAVAAIEPHQAAPHGPCSPSMLLDLANLVYGAHPHAVLVGVGPASLELGEGLSPAVQSAVPHATELVRDLITRS
jgi:hydrogenase maturation protease